MRKISNRKIMKKVTNQMVSGHHFRCFTSAFNEWRYDTIIEKKLDKKIQLSNKILYEKCLSHFQSSSKRARLNNKVKKLAKNFYLWKIFNNTVYDILCNKITERRLRHKYNDKIDKYCHNHMLKFALNNLTLYQKLQRALRFRQIKVYDEFMFHIKRIVNITRYHKALMNVGLQMNIRKSFHKFRFHISHIINLRKKK